MSHLPLAGTEFAVPVLASLWWFRTDTFLDVGELGASVLPASRFFFFFSFFFLERQNQGVLKAGTPTT